MIPEETAAEGPVTTCRTFYTEQTFAPDRELRCRVESSIGGLGAGWAGRAGRSDVVTRKTRIYEAPPVGPGEKKSKFTKITSSQGFLHRLPSRQLYSWFSYLTSKLLFQQCFIIHFLQQFRGIRLGKKPQIIKE